MSDAKAYFDAAVILMEGGLEPPTLDVVLDALQWEVDHAHGPTMVIETAWLQVCLDVLRPSPPQEGGE